MTPDPGVSEGVGYTFTYDAAEPDQPTVAIVEAVAWVTGVEPLDLPPLHDAVDTDALNQHFDPTDGGEFYRSSANPPSARPSLTFEYEGLVVTVTPTGIEVEEPG